jgi:hypothetical protein
LGAVDFGGAAFFARLARVGTALRSAAAVLRRFAAFGAAPLVFFFIGNPKFFMDIPKKTCRDSPSQDSPFLSPCHALPKLGRIL